MQILAISDGLMEGWMRQLVVGNWKMNGTQAEAVARINALAQGLASVDATKAELVVCPPFVHLPAVLAHAPAGLKVGGQNCHHASNGAYTGEISAVQLADLGCGYVIVGHSERRHGLGESNAVVLQKAKAAQSAGVVPIICVGETEAERMAGKAEAVITQQLQESLPDRSAGAYVVAYEPVWAIGTGKVASLQDIAQIHDVMRENLKDETIPLLYGGSVKPENAAEIMALANVNGVLVGGASLDAAAFLAIAGAVP